MAPAKWDETATEALTRPLRNFEKQPSATIVRSALIAYYVCIHRGRVDELNRNVAIIIMMHEFYILMTLTFPVFFSL